MFENLRKYGLDYCDFPTMSWNVSTLLRTLTLDIDSRHKKGIPWNYYIMVMVLGASYFYVFLISIIWLVLWKFPETGDVTAAIIATSLLINCQIGFVKLVISYAYRKTLKVILDAYLEYDARTVPNSRMSKNMLKSLRTIKKRAMIFWLGIMFNGVVYVADPMLRPGRHITEDDKIILLGLDPVETSPNYELSCIFVIGAVTVTCYIPANITSLMIVLSGYTEAQMLALSEELLNLWEDAEKYFQNCNEDISPDATESKKKEIINEYIREKLEDIAYRHAANITIIRQVEKVFRVPIAAEFVILTMGLIAGFLGGIENTYLQAPFALAQVSMDCLTGQWLIDASVVFEDAIYDCKWENFDVANRKMVQLMLQISQNNMMLSAGGIATLSFRSLMGIYRVVYSVYTALRSNIK